MASNPFRLDDRVAVVTGGGSGIGQAIAREFAAAGAEVVVLDVNQKGAEETLGMIKAEGKSGALCIGDVSREQDIKAAIDLAIERFGRLDIMANIAGFAENCQIVDLQEEDFDRMYNVHLKGTMFGTKHALKTMIAAGAGGVVINMASQAVDAAGSSAGAYTAMKSGINGFTKVAAAEAGKHNIRCNVLAPGLILTPLTLRHGVGPDGKFDKTRYDAFVDQLKAMNALDRIGQPEDIAWAAVYLASEAGRYVTGHTLRVGGGIAPHW